MSNNTDQLDVPLDLSPQRPLSSTTRLDNHLQNSSNTNCFPALVSVQSTNHYPPKNVPYMNVNLRESSCFQHYDIQHRHPYCWKCRCCSMRFRTKQKLENHQRAHMGLKPFTCKWPGCKHSCSQQSNVVKHIRRTHFKLPETKKEQEELQIVDNRNANEFIEVNHEMLKTEVVCSCQIPPCQQPINCHAIFQQDAFHQPTFQQMYIPSMPTPPGFACTMTNCQCKHVSMQSTLSIAHLNSTVLTKKVTKNKELNDQYQKQFHEITSFNQININHQLY